MYNVYNFNSNVTAFNPYKSEDVTTTGYNVKTEYVNNKQ